MSPGTGIRRERLAALAQRQTAILGELLPLIAEHAGEEVAALHHDAVREAFHRALHAGGAYPTAMEVRRG